MKKKIINDRDLLREKYETLNWLNYDNPKDGYIEYNKSNSKFYIIESEIYLKGEDANQYCWWSFGKDCIEADFLIIGDSYTIYLSYYDDGFVKLMTGKMLIPNNGLKK